MEDGIEGGVKEEQRREVEKEIRTGKFGMFLRSSMCVANTPEPRESQTGRRWKEGRGKEERERRRGKEGGVAGKEKRGGHRGKEKGQAGLRRYKAKRNANHVQEGQWTPQLVRCIHLPVKHSASMKIFFVNCTHTTILDTTIWRIRGMRHTYCCDHN